MVVRIRYAKAPIAARRKKRRAAMAVAALLNPAAVMAFTLALWGFMAERELAGSFAITSGTFSHWQTWLSAAAAIELCAVALNRYGSSGGAAAV